MTYFRRFGNLRNTVFVSFFRVVSYETRFLINVSYVHALVSSNGNVLSVIIHPIFSCIPDRGVNGQRHDCILRHDLLPRAHRGEVFEKVHALRWHAPHRRVAEHGRLIINPLHFKIGRIFIA